MPVGKTTVVRLWVALGIVLFASPRRRWPRGILAQLRVRQNEEGFFLCRECSLHAEYVHTYQPDVTILTSERALWALSPSFEVRKSSDHRVL